MFWAGCAASLRSSGRSGRRRRRRPRTGAARDTEPSDALLGLPARGLEGRRALPHAPGHSRRDQAVGRDGPRLRARPRRPGRGLRGRGAPRGHERRAEPCSYPSRVSVHRRDLGPHRPRGPVPLRSRGHRRRDARRGGAGRRSGGRVHGGDRGRGTHDLHGRLPAPRAIARRCRDQRQLGGAMPEPGGNGGVPEADARVSLPIRTFEVEGEGPILFDQQARALEAGREHGFAAASLAPGRLASRAAARAPSFPGSYPCSRAELSRVTPTLPLAAIRSCATWPAPGRRAS